MPQGLREECCLQCCACWWVVDEASVDAHHATAAQKKHGENFGCDALSLLGVFQGIGHEVIEVEPPV